MIRRKVVREAGWVAIAALCAVGMGIPRAQAEERIVLTEPEEKPKIIVSATAEVTAKPDLATVELVVTSNESKLQKAFEKNTEASNRILAALKQHGVKADDIRTLGYHINPVYDGKRKPIRYTVTHQVAAKVRSFETLGPILDDAVDEEVTEVRQITFSVEEPYKLEKEARIKAAQLVREKAEDLADNAKTRLGRALKITEGVTWPGPIRMRDQQVRMYQQTLMAEKDLYQAPEVAPGTLKFTVTCHAEYALEP